MPHSWDSATCSWLPVGCLLPSNKSGQATQGRAEEAATEGPHRLCSCADQQRLRLRLRQPLLHGLGRIDHAALVYPDIHQPRCSRRHRLT